MLEKHGTTGATGLRLHAKAGEEDSCQNSKTDKEKESILTLILFIQPSAVLHELHSH